ncbi:MAG: hypothetical protein AAFX86_06610 [Pseudomonadota bacterium]
MRVSFLASAMAALAVFAAPSATAGEFIGDLDCSAKDVVVYFAPGEATLTPAAEALLDHIADLANPCTLTSVETEAWAFDAIEPEAADALAEARKISVLSALAERSLIARAHVQMPSQLSEADRDMPVGRSVYATLRLAVPSVG